MRKLALVCATAALWLFVAAATASADGGPHTTATNNGTAGLTADSCAGCHRAHTAEAASLLNAEQPAICLNCHDGSKATTDVVDGVQYSATAKTTPVLGALRGGGFQYALIDSANAAKVVVSDAKHQYNAHVSPLASGVAVTSTHGGTGGVYAAGWGTGTVWGNGALNSGTGATVTLECASCHNPHGNGQYRILQTTPSLTATTGTFTVAIGGDGVEIADTSTTGTHNYTIKPASDAYNQGGSATNIVTAATGDYWRYHWDPTGVTSWTTATPPKDQMNIGWNGTSATNAKAYGTASTTLGAGMLAADKCLAASSATGFPAVPFAVKVDSEYIVATAITPTTTCASGWTVTRAAGGSVAAAHNSGATVALTAFNAQGPNGQAVMNTTGLMTAWCIQCHTRYSGLKDASGSPSSLSTANPTSDSSFMYKHGTTSAGCEQCHVSHGSNAVMTGTSSLNYTDPNGKVPAKVTIGAVTSGDSRLLKADNRGTCQLCHDPTGTIADGQYLGPIPTPGN